MRLQGVRAFVPYNGRLEGVVPWPYLDILGLVTVAIGNLIDPAHYAAGLPFVHLDGRPATREEIAAQWQAVKNDPKAAKLGHRYAERLTTIRLTPEGVEKVVLSKLASNERELVKRFPEFPEWNVDAQFFAHSISWACGAGFRFPRLEDAMRDRDWEEALKHCHMNDAGPDRIPGNADDNWGLKPRNVAQKIILANAAKVQAYKLDPDELLYPVPGLRPEDTAKPSLPIMPKGHAPPRQSPVLPEEVTGSGGTIHVMPTWPSYRD